MGWGHRLGLFLGILSSGCGLTNSGLGAAPDATVGNPDASPPAAESGVEGAADVVALDDGPSGDAQPMDAAVHPEGGDAASDARVDAPDGASCDLEGGATLCCGTIPCKNHDSMCTDPGMCAACVDAGCMGSTPVCCANPAVDCQPDPGSC